MIKLTQLISVFFLVFTAVACEPSSTNMQKIDVQKGKIANDTITLGGGCYWCVEAIYERVDGVVSVTSGFSGGFIKNPSYEQVCTGKTGHAEVIQIAFDSTMVSTKELLKVFFTVHDPTTLNRQGNDFGTQYRSVIFYHSSSQKKVADEVLEALNKEKAYSNPVVTEISPLTNFYKAEDYHQDYYDNNKEQSYCRLVIQPKIEKFDKVFGKDKEK